MHIKLTEQQVLEIYSYRPLPDTCGERSPLAGRSSELSRIYGISTKAIRDIWNLRSWAHVTQKDADTAEKAGSPTGEVKPVLAVRQPPGRPMLLKEASKSKSRKRARSDEEDGDDTRTGAALFEVLLDLAKRRREDGTDASGDVNHTVSSTSAEDAEGKDDLAALAGLNKDVLPFMGQGLSFYNMSQLAQAQNLKQHELHLLSAQMQLAQMNNFMAVTASFPQPMSGFGVMPVSGFPNASQWGDMPPLQPLVGVQNV